MLEAIVTEFSHLTSMICNEQQKPQAPNIIVSSPAVANEVTLPPLSGIFYETSVEKTLFVVSQMLHGSSSTEHAK